MQDNRRQLKGDGRGVADLPIKLLVIMVVLCVAIPIVVNAADSSQKSIVGNDMDRESERILDAVSVVYYSGNGSSRTLEMDLPQGCELYIGGEGTDAYSIRSVYNGEIVSTKYFEKPPVAFGETITVNGSCTLMISCGENNTMSMVVA